MMLKYIHIYVVLVLLFAMPLVAGNAADAQGRKPLFLSKVKVVAKPASKKAKPTRIFYGQASFYASKFEGRKTATGETFRQNKLTAACNFLPLGTWIKVTNLKNGRTVIAKTNDRLHTKTKRIVDLSRSGAKKLGYLSTGLTRVKVEVLKNKPVL